MPFNQMKIIIYLALFLFFYSFLTGCARDLPPLPSFAAPAMEEEPAPEPAFVEAAPNHEGAG